jgi:hypothetical protein
MAQPPTHRGLAPKDARLFAARELPTLRTAAQELCWLLDRGYATPSALVLVGNRHTLTSRQRLALLRWVCSATEARLRCEREVAPDQLRGRELWLDGYNILTVLESALSGGIVLLGRDGCCRDIAGIHRRYHKVQETIPVLRMIGETSTALGVTVCRWWLDKPVSNSGRLKALILEVARDAGWRMEVDLHFSPDRVLAQTDEIIATSDGMVLERCQRWVNLARLILAERIPAARVLPFADD